MKLVYLSNAQVPSTRAHSVHVMKMCQAFKENNVDVTLYADGIGNETEELIFTKYGIKNKFNLKRVYINKRLAKIVPHLICSVIKTAILVKKNEEADILYGRSLFSLFLLKNSNEFVYESHISPRFKKVEELLLKSKNCLYLVVISQALKKEYIDVFPWLNPDKIIVLHDGADLAIQHIQSKELLANDSSEKPEVIIGYLGHLYPGKCMEILIQIALKRPNYLFHVVGGTDDWVDYWKAECRIRSINNIIFYGYVDNSLTGEYYNSIDIFLLPFSKDIFYNKEKKGNIGKWISPLKLFEAMSYGKAILASRLQSIEEVLVNNYNAILVEPDDTEAWISNLDVMLSDEKLRNYLGSNAKQDFEEKYTWKKRAKNIIDALGEKRD